MGSEASGKGSCWWGLARKFGVFARMHIDEVLRRPLITEKGTLLQERGKYVFKVAKNAAKHQIKEAVEAGFKVDVLKVNVITVHGKKKRMGRREVVAPSWKKAVVTLAPGQKIEFFQGV